jgi:hypothetical protein
VTAPRPALSWVMLVVGSLNLTRLIAESVEFGLFSLQIMVPDIVLGIMAIASGVGLMRPRGWGWSLGIMTWGALGMYSIVLLSLFSAVLVPPLGEGESFYLLPRVAYYGLVLLLCPYGVWAVLIQERPEKASRRILMAWLVAGLLLALGAYGVMVHTSS